MDFGDLIILLIFLAPFLGRLFGKKPPKPAPPLENAPERQIDDPLADALRQIREALGDEATAREPAPEPVSLRPRAERAFDDTFGGSIPDDEFREIGEFEHERHGFGAENPLSEEVFEKQPAFVTTGGTDPIGTHAPKPADITTPLEVRKPDISGENTLAGILRNPQRAREAFILHEVFDGPRSQTRNRRR